MSVGYHEVCVKSALNKLKRKMPYQWDLNVYRGCQHGCRYCYALYSHQHYEDQNFYQDIHVKTNIVELLEKELKKNSWKQEIINFGGITDCYQPAEAKYEIMPDLLKLLIRYETPAIISTKSILPLRDFDLIRQLADKTYVNIAASVTTVDENLRKGLEPYCAPTKDRFDMLRAFSETNASIGVHMMPIIPYLTDSMDNQRALLEMAKSANASYVLPGVMYLRGVTRPYFMTYVKAHSPDVYKALVALYTRGGAGKPYKMSFYAAYNQLRDEIGLSDSYSKPIKEKLKEK